VLAFRAMLHEHTPVPVRTLAAPPAPHDYRGFVEVRRPWLSESAVAYEVSQALEECYAVSLALAPADPLVPVAVQRSWAAMAASETVPNRPMYQASIMLTLA